MEMPEGWKRYVDYCDLKETGTHLGIPKKEAKAFLDLVKEMAEALHLIRTSADHGLTGLNGYKLCADKVLKKWREWK